MNHSLAPYIEFIPSFSNDMAGDFYMVRSFEVRDLLKNKMSVRYGDRHTIHRPKYLVIFALIF